LANRLNAGCKRCSILFDSLYATSQPAIHTRPQVYRRRQRATTSGEKDDDDDVSYDESAKPSRWSWFSRNVAVSNPSFSDHNVESSENRAGTVTRCRRSSSIRSTGLVSGAKIPPHKCGITFEVLQQLYVDLTCRPAIVQFVLVLLHEVIIDLEHLRSLSSDMH
jgi:hypothetical protein